MKITKVQGHKIEKEGSNVKGVVEITLDDCFVVKDIRIIEKEDKIVVAMPSKTVNVKDESGKLVESLIFLDSLKHGLNSTHVSFYENMINYSTELNGGKVVKSAVFDHIPLPEYKSEYTKLVDDEFRSVNGFVGMSPVINDNTKDLFPKFKELGSTTTMLCGHDHMNSYYTELDGIKLGYAMKSSEGDDEGGEPYKYMMGGCYLTVDGVNEDKIEYKQYSDFDYTIMKSGVEVSESLVKKIKKIYKDYKTEFATYKKLFSELGLN